jgi:hypothetical protein
MQPLPQYIAPPTNQMPLPPPFAGIISKLKIMFYFIFLFWIMPDGLFYLTTQ